MLKILARKLLLIPPTLFGVLTVVFLITRLIPGDPAVVILGEYTTPESLKEMRQLLGLDQPIYVQYGQFFLRILQGDLGTSIRTDGPVLEEILHVFPFTVELALAGLLISVVIGVPLGIFSATHRNTSGDYLSMMAALLGASAPVFWIGILLILFFGLHLGWFPVIGAGDPENVLDLLHHLFLPAVTLGTFTTALTARLTRSSMLEILQDDYILTARSKGLEERTVIWRHAFQNALIPVVTIVGLNLGRMMGGAIVTETVFARPGLGRLLVDSIYARDYPQIQATIAFFATVFILVNTFVDISYAYIDPRVDSDD